MLDVFMLTLNKVGVLLIFIGIGYLFRRKELLPENAGRVMSLLCTMLFAPAYSLNNVSKQFTRDVFVEKMLLVGYGVLILVAVVVVGRVLGKLMGRSDVDRSSLTYAFTFPNYGYFGYPVVEGVFGSALLADFIIFALPTSIACSSYGYVLFQKEKNYKWTNVLKIPLVWGSVIGAIIGLSGITLPAVLSNVLTSAGNCMSPCSMLLAGFMLGKFPLKKLFNGIRPYYLTAIRMLGIPLLFGAVLMLCGVRGMYLFCPLVLVCLPLGLNLVVYPESYGYEKEAGDNAKLCFISYLLALIILPFIFAFLTWLCM